MLCPRFADILKTLGRSVSFAGKRSDVALDLSNQLWHNSDKEVRRWLLPPDLSLSARNMRHPARKYILLLSYCIILLLHPSGVGLIQETDQASVLLRAPVFVVLRLFEEVPPPPGAAASEAFL